MARRRFNPSLHPRNGNGEFRRKSGGSSKTSTKSKSRSSSSSKRTSIKANPNYVAKNRTPTGSYKGPNKQARTKVTTSVSKGRTELHNNKANVTKSAGDREFTVGTGVFTAKNLDTGRTVNRPIRYTDTANNAKKRKGSPVLGVTAGILAGAVAAGAIASVRSAQNPFRTIGISDYATTAAAVTAGAVVGHRIGTRGRRNPAYAIKARIS